MEPSIGEKFLRFASGNNNKRTEGDISDAYRAAKNPPFENNIQDVTKINAETAAAKTRSALCRPEIRARKLESEVTQFRSRAVHRR